jgi:hypothetical protein
MVKVCVFTAASFFCPGWWLSFSQAFMVAGRLCHKNGLKGESKAFTDYVVEGWAGAYVVSADGKSHEAF